MEVEREAAGLRYWFDIPAWAEPGVAGRHDHWVLIMAVLGAYFGEPVRVAGPVDRLLLDNLDAVQQLWVRWYDWCSPVAFDVDSVVNADRSNVHLAEGRTASCFSGGVDSFFTLLRHRDGAFGDGRRSVSDLVSIAGFNTPVDDYDGMERQLGDVADRFHKGFVPVLTNIRYGDHPLATPFSSVRHMVEMAYGPLLAAVGHMLGDRYDEFLIPSSSSFAERGPEPNGSTPVVDPLLGSSTLQIVHDGLHASRVRKTAAVLSEPIVAEHLHVCFRPISEGNCSRCRKCLRTMAAVDLVGQGRIPAFRWERYGPSRLRTQELPESEIRYVRDLVDTAARLGRSDIEHALRWNLRTRRPGHWLRRLAVRRRIRQVRCSLARPFTAGRGPAR